MYDKYSRTHKGILRSHKSVELGITIKKIFDIVRKIKTTFIKTVNMSRKN